MTDISRRTFAKLSATAAAVPFGPSLPGTLRTEDELQSEFLLDLTLETDPPQDIGAIGGGGLLIVPIKSGTFEGPRIRGSVLPPAADWLAQRPDGTRVPDVRLLVRTDDSQLISVTWRGIAYAPQGAPFYARITPSFQTSSPQYAWLNNVVAVGVYRKVPGKVAYRVYQIL